MLYLLLNTDSNKRKISKAFYTLWLVCLTDSTYRKHYKELYEKGKGNKKLNTDRHNIF